MVVEEHPTVVLSVQDLLQVGQSVDHVLRVEVALGSVQQHFRVLADVADVGVSFGCILSCAYEE